MAGGYWSGQCRSGTFLSLWEVLLGSADLWAPSFLCLVFSGLTVRFLGVFITFIWLQVHWTWICKLIASPKFRKVVCFFKNYFFRFFFSPSISLPFLHNSTSKVAQVVKNLPACAEAVEMWVWSLGRRIPWRRKMATHSSISCLKNSMDQGVRQAAVHGVAKSQTQLNIHTPLSRVTTWLSPQIVPSTPEAGFQLFLFFLSVLQNG